MLAPVCIWEQSGLDAKRPLMDPTRTSAAKRGRSLIGRSGQRRLKPRPLIRPSARCEQQDGARSEWRNQNPPSSLLTSNRILKSGGKNDHYQSIAYPGFQNVRRLCSYCNWDISPPAELATPPSEPFPFSPDYLCSGETVDSLIEGDSPLWGNNHAAGQ